MPGIEQIILALVLSGVVSGISYGFKFLSRSGAAAATFLGTIVLGLGGWAWVYPLLAFFVSSSLLSLARKRYYRSDTEAAKGSQRDAVQVLANGGLAGVMVLAQTIANYDFFPIYLGSLAAAAADTWSTEIGLLFGRQPRNIVNFQPVSVGTSGGVTLVGFLGAFSGALLLAYIGFLSAPGRISREFVIIIMAGFLGSVADSLLGATIQARQRCPVCAKITEKPRHCGQPTQHVGGWRWLNNDGVNAFCTACGALVALLLTEILP